MSLYEKYIRPLVENDPNPTPRKKLKLMLVDMLTIGLGFITLAHSFVSSQTYDREDIANIGSTLFILGILLHVWRRNL